MIMQTTKTVKTAWLVAALSIAGWVTTQAQPTAYNANWQGPASPSSGDWNTAANWSTGVVPGSDAIGITNAVIPYISTSSSNVVTYGSAMAAAGFGGLTNWGILTVSAGGFNNTGIFLAGSRANPAQLIATTAAAVINVNGNLGATSNSVVTLGGGASMTIQGSLLIGCGITGGTGSGNSGSIGIMTNSGGFLSASATQVNPVNSAGPSSSGQSSLLVISGGTNNLGTTSVKRSNASSGGYQTLGTEGLIIYGGLVTMTNLNVGGSAGNSWLTTLIAGGTVTNFGVGMTINDGTTTGRPARLLQTGGLFVVPDPEVVNPNPSTAGALSAVYSVQGGTNIVGGFYFGLSNSAVAATTAFTNAATIYVGSQGIATNGAVLFINDLKAGGLFGATAPWTGSAPMSFIGTGSFTFKTADMAGNPNNITLAPNAVLSGPSTCALNVTGSGTLTLGATNTYTAATLINGGTLALGAGSSIASPLIIVGNGSTFDASAVSGGFVLLSGQTLSGSGSVNGGVSGVTLASGATINPGSNLLTGPLTFNGSVTESGGAINHFDLSGAPTGPNNDLVIINGDLDVTGMNNIDIGASGLVSGSAYPVIKYTGNFTGPLASVFQVTGAFGTLSNNDTTKIIYFVPAVAQRGPANTVWIGSPTNANWDYEASTNWLNAGALDVFVTGDNVQFTDAGAGNSPTNIVGGVQPGSILVNSQSNYVFASTSGGYIASSPAGINLTVTNTGTLTILTTNTYTGITTVEGGATLAVSQLASIGSPGAVGESDGLVISNGTFSYSGPTVSIDRGVTLEAASSAINISANGNLTLGGILAGAGGLTKIGPGTLALGSSGSYSGGTTIAGGVLQLNNASGASSGAINFNNGTLAYYPSGGIDVVNPFNFTAGTTNQIIVTSGSGGNPLSDGVWSGSGVVLVNNRYNPYTVNGDLNPFTGTVLLTTASTSTTNVFRFNSGGGNSMVGSTNATFDLGTNNGTILTCRNSGTMNLGALQGGSGTILQGQGSGSGTVIWSIGNNNLSTIFAGSIQDSTSARISSVTKIGTGRLTLAGQSTYTGATTVSNGVLALAYNPTNSNDGSINNSATLNVVPGAFIDVSGRSDQTLQVGASATQQLRGRGTINGNLNVSGSGTVAPGGGPGGDTGTLTVTNNINLGGTAWMKVNRASSPNSDQLVSSLGTINYGGTLVLTNIGAPLQAGDTFTLFSAKALSGSASSFTLALPRSYVWDTSRLGVDGSLTVTGIVTPPVISKVVFTNLANGTLTFYATYPNATNYLPNSIYVNILTSTNVAAPLSSWTVIGNGMVDDGTYAQPPGQLLDPASVTPGVVVPVNSSLPKSFFILQWP
jgi:autotransporter-associated beta strand protein